MSTQAIGRQAGTEFSTSDPDQAMQYMQTAYGTGLMISGLLNGQELAHSRMDGGSFALDNVRLPLHMSVRQEPLNSLIIVTLVSGTFERECGQTTERFLPGDIFIDADPSQPATLRLTDVQVRTMMLDLALLARVATTSSDAPSTRAATPVRFTSFQPIVPAAITRWKHTTRYLSDLLADSEAAAHPLILGNAARLAAATALTTFPNTAVNDPTAQDRRDATSTTVRRAVAFIEQHPDTDISLTDIAAATQVSVRTLQVAFRRHRDTTPMRYLRSVRLDRVHRALLAADPRGATVTDIAGRWGFYNHSRFAAEYYRTYGVRPRQTLRLG